MNKKHLTVISATDNEGDFVDIRCGSCGKVFATIFEEDPIKSLVKEVASHECKW